MLTRLKLRALGFRIIKHSSNVLIIRTPFWLTGEAKRKAVDNAAKDFAVEGKPIRITVGHRLVRLERVVSAK